MERWFLTLLSWIHQSFEHLAFYQCYQLSQSIANWYKKSLKLFGYKLAKKLVTLQLLYFGTVLQSFKDRLTHSSTFLLLQKRNNDDRHMAAKTFALQSVLENAAGLGKSLHNLFVKYRAMICKLTCCTFLLLI